MEKTTVVVVLVIEVMSSRERVMRISGREGWIGGEGVKGRE